VICNSGPTSFSVTTAGGGGGTTTYRWQAQIGDDWIDLTDGPRDGSDGFCADISGSATMTLTVSRPPRCFGAGQPRPQVCRCVVSNACGSVLSNVATLTVCPADFNCDDTLNSADFFDFLTAFFTIAPAADFNADGFINSQDYFNFLGAFFAGCG
jgi:hypothetical protein